MDGYEWVTNAERPERRRWPQLGIGGRLEDPAEYRRWFYQFTIGPPLQAGVPEMVPSHRLKEMGLVGLYRKVEQEADTPAIVSAM